MSVDKSYLGLFVLGLLALSSTGCSAEEDDDKDGARLVHAAIKGTLTSTGNASARTHFAYDARGRVIRETAEMDGAQWTREKKYGFAASSLGDGELGDVLVAETTGAGETVAYERDASGLVRAVRVASGDGAPAALVDAITYAADDAVTSVKVANGTTQARSYRPDGRIARIKTAKADEALQDLAYDYDAAGNVASIVDAIDRKASSTFTYDARDRLVRWSEPGDRDHEGPRHVYAYDASDNVVSFDGTEQRYGENAGPHALTRAGDIAFEYDANGNLVRASDGLAITYSPENLPLAIGRGGDSVERHYLGESAWKIVENGKTSVHPWAGLTIVDGHPRTTFARFAERGDDGKLRFFHDDHLGSSVLVTDDVGSVVFQGAYTPFGEPRDSPPRRNAFSPKTRFHGKEMDVFGFLDFGARLYAPRFGRWLTPDTVLEAGQNRYTYARNNPIGRIDPDGHVDQSATCDDPTKCPPKKTAPEQAIDATATALGVADQTFKGVDAGLEINKQATRTLSAAKGAKALKKFTGPLGAASDIVGAVSELNEAHGLAKQGKHGYAAEKRGHALGKVIGSKVAPLAAPICGPGAPACALVLDYAGGELGGAIGEAAGSTVYQLKTGDYYRMRDNFDAFARKSLPIYNRAPAGYVPNAPGMPNYRPELGTLRNGGTVWVHMTGAAPPLVVKQ